MHEKKSRSIEQIIKRVLLLVVRILERSMAFWLLREHSFVTNLILLRRVLATLENHLFLFSVLRINF